MFNPFFQVYYIKYLLYSQFGDLETALKLSPISSQTGDLSVSFCDIFGQLNTDLAKRFKSWQGHPYKVGIVCSSWLEQGNKKVGAKRWLGLILVIPLFSAVPETQPMAFILIFYFFKEFLILDSCLSLESSFFL